MSGTVFLSKILISSNVMYGSNRTTRANAGNKMVTHGYRKSQFFIKPE